jgi:hypothetical protein
MLRIICIRSTGMFSYSPMTYHNFSRLMESYALRRSMKAIPSCLLVLMLCWIMVWSMSACSMVVWCARNPAWVGAWRLSVLAVVVSLALIVAMNTFARGGGMAMLR